MTASVCCEICIKCNGKLVEDFGMLFCGTCGIGTRKICDARLTAFNQSYGVLKGPYSRKSRFEKKLLASLRCNVNYVVDEDILKYLQSKRIENPQDVLFHISKYKVARGKRRPYLYVMYYWRALGREVPTLTDRDLFCLREDFDKIYFAWERKKFPPPLFPYAFLFRRIVSHGGDRYSEGLHKMTEFVRTLRCKERLKRYENLFQQCINFDYENVFGME